MCPIKLFNVACWTWTNCIIRKALCRWRQIIFCGSPEEKNRTSSRHLMSSLCAAAVAHHADKDPRHLHPAVRAVWLPAVCGTSSRHLQTHWGMVCARVPVLCCHHADHHRLWGLCGRYERRATHWRTQPDTVLASNVCIKPVDLRPCSDWRSLLASVAVSRRLRNRVPQLLQTSGAVLDSGGTCLLCRHPQHDWILAQSHLQEDQGRGMRPMSF